ncbi:MAG: anaerobic sulfatase maturase [Deltaproteobacteria bacterium]|nr:anaerobic sulfatase maturase [Deltaproteobacteria bacterium]
MTRTSREFQVFAKPIGAACNLACRYCYYRDKTPGRGAGGALRMSEETLEAYIVQHMAACPTPTVRFSWHGGEPTLLGIDYFRRIVALQRKHRPPGSLVANGIQTNGLLLDEEWCRFLKAEGFSVGLSLDGPRELHDLYRVTLREEPTHERVLRAHALLREHRIPCDLLCVVHARNAAHPGEVYGFFKEIGASYLGFLPLVERRPDAPSGVSDRSVPAEAFGAFLCALFDEWLARDIGRVKVQFFEEMTETALGLEQALCTFKRTCGDVPVVEHDGEFYACDHFVDAKHRVGNIHEIPLVELLESPAQRAFGEAKREALPLYCRSCDVLGLCNGGCPKDRFLRTPAGEPGLNYLCAGYKRFFAHARGFVAEVERLHRQTVERQATPVPPREPGAGEKAGRNDPCLCGSGRKYKKCCLGR